MISKTIKVILVPDPLYGSKSVTRRCRVTIWKFLGLPVFILKDLCNG